METILRLANPSVNVQLTLKQPDGTGNQGWLTLKILRYRQLQSTNTTAYRLGENGSADWTVVTAEVQTRGRGRAGKKWESPRGGLWFSILLRPDINSTKVSLMQFLAANATRQALEEETGIHVQLKWPNDLVLESGKIGGILVESKTKADSVQFAVLGIGLNVNQHKNQLPKGATSLLLASGLETDRRSLLKRIINQIRSSYDDINDPAAIMQEWWHNCIHRPPRVQVTLPKGTITGITRGIDQEGSLIVETEDRRVERISEGTLRLLDESSK